MRFTHLNAELRPLSEGIDPPVGSIRPDYKEQPGVSRKCPVCGRWHDTIIENSYTGERLHELEKCKDCEISGLS